jgi:hypothetical protein
MAAEDLYLRSLSDKGEVGNPTNLRLRSAADKTAAKTRNMKVRVGGVWVAVSKVWTMVSDSWVEGSISSRVAGTWELIHEK